MHCTPVACHLICFCAQLLTKTCLHLMWSCVTEIFTRVWITVGLNAGIVSCIMHSNTNMPGPVTNRTHSCDGPNLVFVASYRHYHHYHDHHNPDCRAEVSFRNLLSNLFSKVLLRIKHACNGTSATLKWMTRAPCSAGLWDAVLMAIHVAKSTHRESYLPINRLCQQNALLSRAACQRTNAERCTQCAEAILKLQTSFAPVSCLPVMT